MDSRRERLAAARLYLICEEPTDEFLHAALRGGVEIVQLRCKAAEDARILAAAQRCAAVCAEHGALLIINDRPDLAVAAEADGVHIGQDDVPVTAARTTVGDQRIVGLSTHSPEQIDAARRPAVDYIGVGPVYATPTKPGRPAVGVPLVRYAATHARVPFFAIGGLEPGTIGPVLGAGATRVAVVRALGEAGDPELAARVLRGALGQEAGVGAA
ncbi:MAG: thiamine phosphate synthase [Solirubrobacteraceae bacterium]